MKINNLPLSKIVNVSTALLLVVLALSLHSLAAEVKNELNKPEPVPAPKASKAKTQPSSTEKTISPAVGKGKNFVTEEELGWKKTRKSKSADHESPIEESALSDPLTHEAEQKLEETIKKRREENNSQYQYLNDQKTALEKEKKDLSNKFKELDQKTTELSQDQAIQKKNTEEKITRLARVYEQMPPRDAAAIFNILDMRVLVPVAQHMTPRKVSAVIGGMSPDRANILTQYLIGARKLPSDRK